MTAPRIYIYEGEARRLARWVREFDDLETGGELLGQYLPSGALVVHLVTGPGPRARRSTVSFHQDGDYLRSVCTEAFRRHALQHAGSWHSHHTLALAEPSGGDSATVVRALRETGAASFVLVIANLADENGHPSRRGTPHVRGFVYRHGRRGDYEPATWTLLPGRSPVHSDRVLAGLLAKPAVSRSPIRLTPLRTEAHASQGMRRDSWALQPEGARLVSYAARALRRVGSVRMFPNSTGLLEIHVERVGERWVAAFAHETSRGSTKAWLSRLGAADAERRAITGSSDAVIDEMVETIAGEISAGAMKKRWET